MQEEKKEENKKEEIVVNKKSNIISIDDFKKVDIAVGKILSAEKVPDTDKLLKLSVDLGLKKFSPENFSPEHSAEPNVLGEERDIRQIVSGISLYFPDCSILVGKQCMFVANLESRMIKGVESQGMILAVAGENGEFSLLEPNDTIKAGTRAR
jgi:methionyl-tRNA synthetase